MYLSSIVWVSDEIVAWYYQGEINNQVMLSIIVIIHAGKGFGGAKWRFLECLGYDGSSRGRLGWYAYNQ